jgi:hypothetical protein
VKNFTFGHFHRASGGTSVMDAGIFSPRLAFLHWLDAL